MGQDSTTQWFIAQLKPNCSQIAVRNLTRQGIATFLPTEEVTVRKSQKFTIERRPFFPGYAFVALDTDAGPWRSVNATYGVSRILCFGHKPAPVPDRLIAELRHRCDPRSQTLAPHDLVVGDSVRVAAGPFVDFVGRILEVEPDRRIWVLLELLGGGTRVCLEATQVKRNS